MGEMDNVTIHPSGWWESNDDVPHLLVPSICNWIINFFKNDKDQPLHDFGCGLGHYLAKIADAGYTNLIGYEGKIAKNSIFTNIIEQNIAFPFDIPNKGNVICLEVGEHIPAEFMGNLLTNLATACAPGKHLVLSWAVRGQDYPGHVNMLDNHEVIPCVQAKGFEYMVRETMEAKNAVNDYLHFKNVMVYRKK